MEISNIGITQTPTQQPRGAPAEIAGRPGPAPVPIPAPAAEVAAQQTAVKPEELQKAVDAMNEFVTPLNNSLAFSVDEDSGRTVVKVIDRVTDEVVRQIPSQEALDIARALDKFRGMLIQEKV